MAEGLRGRPSGEVHLRKEGGADGLGKFAEGGDVKEHLRGIDPKDGRSAFFNERKVARPECIGGGLRIDEATADHHMSGIISHAGGGDRQAQGLGLSIEDGKGQRVIPLGKATQRKRGLPGNLPRSVDGMIRKLQLKMLEVLWNTGQGGVGFMTTPISSATA